MPNQDGGHLGFYLNHRTPSYFFLSLHISEVQFFYNARLRELIRTGAVRLYLERVPYFARLVDMRADPG
jgi:hypothetical protein